jgi:hypothetical protein
MKKILTLAILGVTGLVGATGAEANDGRRPHEYRNQPAAERREHREPRPGRVWIAPRYENRIVRYECGRPVYGQVCISAGHWSIEAECR